MSGVAQRENWWDGVQVAERPGRVPPRAAAPALLEKPSAQAGASIPLSPISTFLASPALLSLFPVHLVGSKRASPGAPLPWIIHLLLPMSCQAFHPGGLEWSPPQDSVKYLTSSIVGKCEVEPFMLFTWGSFKHSWEINTILLEQLHKEVF